MVLLSKVLQNQNLIGWKINEPITKIYFKHCLEYFGDKMGLKNVIVKLIYAFSTVPTGVKRYL